MALCTNCGAIVNNKDITKHVCKPSNVPIVGKEKTPSTTEANV